MTHSRLKAKVRTFPEEPGVYWMRDAFGKVVYIGKAKNLKKRVGSYFQNSKHTVLDRPKLITLMELVRDVEYMIVRSETEALIMESRLIKEYKPKFNKDQVDDKGFVFIQVDHSKPLAVFKRCYHKVAGNATYYGPFVHGRAVSDTLREMRLKFGIILGDTQPKQVDQDVYQLYEDARSEIYGHSNQVDLKEYEARVQQACAFLDGKSKVWIQDLEASMQAAAASQDYEKAAYFRDVRAKLLQTTEPVRALKHLDLKSNIDPMQALKSLAEVLGMQNIPRHIECFDISHISGTFVVASMVCLIDGKPSKRHYRRYKLQGGNDDYEAMTSVVYRRYKRVLEEKLPVPDLVVIDGGIGQVGAALTALERLEAPLKDSMRVIGLAKKEETIIHSNGEQARLPRTSPAIHILQRIRDEAHRFANAFNADLRSKAIQTSLLDDCEGVGPATKERLLAHFKTIQCIKKASVQELQQVQGVGQALATRIWKTLRTMGSSA